MVRPILFAGLTLCLLPVYSWAAAPRVVVDIAPLHSIVSEVMSGVGEPKLLIQPEASPHSYSLRPSEAGALAEAEVVFWISEELTPWLENPLANLAGSATKVEMLELSATVKHEYREGANFEEHDHGDDEHHHHGDYDPHAWLDPMNAKVWAAQIAQVLSGADSANANVYRQNARAFADAMDELTASLNERAQRLEGIRVIVFHDAYQYFERRFGLPVAGAISLSDASDPSPARIREIQTMAKELEVTCAYSEPQFNPGLIKTVFEGSEVTTTGILDPLGVAIEPGKGFYPQLLNSLMASLEQCRS
ncbi:zinc ABC transporter substrate-binding protein [Marinobacter sp. X15-166B]|uniref:zinc ABC transporter substrate-binding protein n=1 Tax=Marinobacter sp. X15-166B TaxID=1897620 RepID=UPI00085BC0FA|nr:zinc ABC transporter substrate-binding protein [Marinobacter sp. X15-166B]OEY66060.1 zinc transporter [Marinobacter sp. X15-166B]